LLRPPLLCGPPKAPRGITTPLSLAVVFFNAYSGTVAYVRMGRVDYRAGTLFTLASVPGAIIGVLLVHQMPRAFFDPAFGTLLLVLGGFLVVSPLGPAATAAAAGGDRRDAADLAGAVGSAYIAVLASL